MNSEKNLKERDIPCYDCVKPFPRKELRQLRNGDVLICAECQYGRNRRRAKASIKLKKRAVE